MNIISQGSKGAFDHSFGYTLVDHSVEEVKAMLETDEDKFDGNTLDIPHEIHSDYDCTGKVHSEQYELQPIGNLTMIIHYQGLDL